MVRWTIEESDDDNSDSINKTVILINGQKNLWRRPRTSW